MSTETITPLMQQYFAIKEQYPEMLLLFQVGDFYELFFDDAKTAAAFLAITLTKRGKNKGQDIPLCGIPVHALNHYLTKLIKGGFNVALCDQLTKPSPGTVVQRGVTRVFTPGTLTDSLLLEEKSASYLVALYPLDNNYGVIFSELMTAQLFATVVPAEHKRFIEAELSRFFPDEILLPASTEGKKLAPLFKQLGYSTSFAMLPPAEETDAPTTTDRWLSEQFNQETARTILNQPALKNSCNLFYHYLAKNNNQALTQFKSIQFYQPEDYLMLDFATQKNLEIVSNNTTHATKHSLFAVLDKAKTAMGSRAIKKWLLRPLVDKAAIIQRQQMVVVLTEHLALLQQLEALLSQCADLERIAGRIALRRAVVNDYLALSQSLALLHHIKRLINTLPASLSKTVSERIGDFSALQVLLQASINDDPQQPCIIKSGFDQELDRLRHLALFGQQEIINLEKKEIELTGISSLKIRFNGISGYFIEITSSNLDAVPTHYKHQQTLSNRQRFVTPELIALERDLSRAQQETTSLEEQVFDRIKQEVEKLLHALRHAAQAIAYVDGLVGFARTAYDNRYVAPTFNEHGNIIIAEGRHPVIEQTTDIFTPNDTTLSQEQSLLLITGPNMGGKSTYLRQVALICIMAQCGSLVPATHASLPILDRIFTRIGSGDNLAEGKSTFLVEMEETATICTQATAQSLVILDEVGRGTGTYDGIALAQAIIEYLVQQIQARSLFATHYHELTTLANNHPTIKNYHLMSKQSGNTIHFMHKIAPGIAQKSFGIAVARLAELPAMVIDRAEHILKGLEHTGTQMPLFSPPPTQPTSIKINNQKIAVEKISKIFSAVSSLNMQEISPKQAFDRLWELVEETQKP